MLTQKAASPGNPSLNLGALVKGTMYAYLVAIIISVMVGLTLYYSAASDLWLKGSATFIFGFSIFCGSTAASYKAGRKGLFHGIGVAILFLVLASVIGGLVDSPVFSGMILVKKLILAVIAGCLGGILGVGLSK